MPRTKDEALTEKRRNEILDAAARVFVRHGFHRASMRQICGEAKLSAGAVYNYFPSKDQIIEGLAPASRRRLPSLRPIWRKPTMPRKRSRARSG